MLGDGELLSLLLLGVGTAVVLIGALVIVGFVVLARRSRLGIDRVGHELDTKAGSLLLHLDDAVRAAEDELDFAIAQFGTQRTKPYADALAAARADLSEAFRLRQLLDDAYEDTDRQRREWTLQIIANCERAQRRLQEQQAAFRDLRREELGAAATLSEVRNALEEASARLAPAQATLDQLRSRYVPERSAGVAGNVDAARGLLEQAGRILDTVEPRVTDTGVSNVSDDLREAAHLVHQADGLLDEVDEAATGLAEASKALAQLIQATTLELEQARPQREQAPDADSGAAIIDAMAKLQDVVAGAARSNDPVAALDRIGEASERLDLALAGARNQQQRLAHAREALAGALVSARSQIAEAKSVMSGAGVDARTRLAEAERQLGLAEVESDPVEALDTARRAITLARDADALARYARMR